MEFSFGCLSCPLNFTLPFWTISTSEGLLCVLNFSTRKTAHNKAHIQENCLQDGEIVRKHVIFAGAGFLQSRARWRGSRRGPGCVWKTNKSRKKKRERVQQNNLRVTRRRACRFFLAAALRITKVSRIGTNTNIICMLLTLLLTLERELKSASVPPSPNLSCNLLFF